MAKFFILNPETPIAETFVKKVGEKDSKANHGRRVIKKKKKERKHKTSVHFLSANCFKKKKKKLKV